MELRQLAAFDAVAETGGFTQASHRMGLAQSAVSRAVRSLERELDIVLFDRDTHHVGLTPAGRLLLPEARRVLAAADEMRDTVQQVHGGLRGILRLGITQRHPAFPLPLLLAEFVAEHPGIEVRLRRGNTVSHAGNLRNNVLDIAFVAVPRYGGLQVTELSRTAMQLICHPGHRLAAAERVELADLADEPFADVPQDWGVRITNDQAFADAGVRRRVAYEVADINSVVDFVHHGLAVAVVPPAVVTAESNVRQVSLGEPTPYFTFALATADNRRPTPAARAFVETARRVAADSAAS
jgi:DNA-binding transcriptional LysR family regulator